MDPEARSKGLATVSQLREWYDWPRSVRQETRICVQWITVAKIRLPRLGNDKHQSNPTTFHDGCTEGMLPGPSVSDGQGQDTLAERHVYFSSCNPLLTLLAEHLFGF